MNVSNDAIQAMEDAAYTTLRWPGTKRDWDSADKDARIRSLFGAPFIVIADLWERIEPKIDKAGAERKHLLWSLVFLKVYGSSEEVHCAIVGWPCKQTFREWSWYFVEKMYDLQDDVIVFRNRFDGQPDLNDI